MQIKNVVYKSINFENRKLKFYNHCKKWSAKLPYVSKEMEYDLVSNKFEFGLTELFSYQLNSDNIFILIQSDMEDIFERAKEIRDLKNGNTTIRCEDSRKFLHESISIYFDVLFKEFRDVKEIKIPFIDDIRFEILKYIA
jgi:hypothetical protein